MAIGKKRLPTEADAPIRDENPTLEELISGITPENRHPEVDCGLAVGKERFWEDE